MFDKHVHSRSRVDESYEIIIFMAEYRKEIDFCKKKSFVTKDNAFWGKIFSDESNFNTFNSDGRNYMWRGANTEDQR